MRGIRTLRRGTAVLGLVAISGLTACNDDDPMEPTGPIDVSLSFVAEVNGAPFACGQSYSGIGTASTTITPKDLRLYVSDVELLDASGSATPLELDQDGVWQLDNLALLDFENATGACSNGTSATRTVIEGTAPAGTYTGVRFVLGVPFELNHIDQTTAPAPLDLTALFWNWNGGYKFLRFDNEPDSELAGYNVHLGSTGCSPSGNPQTPAVSCVNEHRPVITFNDFDVSSQQIVADVGRLLAGSDLTTNTAFSGCMAFPNDPDCPSIMNRLGLNYEGSMSTGQSFFSVR